MRLADIISAPQSAIAALYEAPFYTELTGKDGLPCRVWKNPTQREFAVAIRTGGATSLAGLRGLLTAADLYVWQSNNLLHADFERNSGVQGLRMGLRSNTIQINDETVAQPEQFPWIFPDAAAATQMEMDMDDRRTIVTERLQANDRLGRVYPNGFTTSWYS